MGLSIHLALTTDDKSVDLQDLTRVSAALSKQLQRDFSPIWDVSATIDAFVSLDDVPSDYWHIIVTSKPLGDAAGYHEDDHGQPFALVQFGHDWSLTASHEMLEMLADPFGRRMKAGLLLDQAVQLGAQPGRVRYLIEVCDPSEDGQYAYQVNGVIVSDFYTPNFLDPVKSAGVRYSFTESMDGPRIVMPNGYISWYDPKAKTWMQLRNFADSESSNVPHLVDLGKNAMFQKHAASKNIRSAVDRVTKVPSFTQDLHGSVKTRMTSSSAFNRQSEESCANELRAVIQGLMPAAKSKK